MHIEWQGGPAKERCIPSMFKIAVALLKLIP